VRRVSTQISRYALEENTLGLNISSFKTNMSPRVFFFWASHAKNKKCHLARGSVATSLSCHSMLY
jgi:hypothetical protein